MKFCQVFIHRNNTTFNPWVAGPVGTPYNAYTSLGEPRITTWYNAHSRFEKKDIRRKNVLRQQDDFIPDQENDY